MKSILLFLISLPSITLASSALPAKQMADFLKSQIDGSVGVIGAVVKAEISEKDLRCPAPSASNLRVREKNDQGQSAFLLRLRCQSSGSDVMITISGIVSVPEDIMVTEVQNINFSFVR